jgi:hypothetical protein
MEKDIDNYVLKSEINQLRSEVDQFKGILKELKEVDSETFKSYMKEVDKNYILSKRIQELECVFGNLITELFSINSNDNVDCLFFGCNCCDVTWHGVNKDGSNLIKEAYKVLNKETDV